MDAVQALVHKIKGAWIGGKVTSMLFLDIEGTFPNMDNASLVKNLIKRRIPKDIFTFIANMLKDRATVLKFHGYTLDTITLNNGIGQGDLLSMAIYQFYNADLLDILEIKDEAAIAYVNDAIIVTTGSTFHDIHSKLVQMMTKPGGALN